MYNKLNREAKNIFNKVLADKKTLKIEKEVQELKNQDMYKIIDIINFEEIPQGKLLSKTGNILVGGTFSTRLLKLSKELEVSRRYKDKIIKFRD